MMKFNNLFKLQNDKLNRWIVPVIQGFIQYEPCIIEHTIDAMGLDEATTVSNLSNFRT